MKVILRPEIDYLSIEFIDVPEARSYLEEGIVVREYKKGRVVGIDILNSSKIFDGGDTLNLKEACILLGISESTLRRRIKQGKIKFTKPNGKDYRFRKSDILKLA